MEQFRQLLLSLDLGQNFKWFNGKKKLPNSADGNIYNFDIDVCGLSVKAVQEICTKMKSQHENMLIIAARKKEDKSICKCQGCPVAQVEQLFVGYREENGLIIQTIVEVSWTKGMSGYEDAYTYQEMENSMFNILSTNENLLFTVGSNFGYSIIVDSI